MLLSIFLIIFRKVNLLLEKLEQWRRKWVDVSTFWSELQIGLSESRKPCLNLCSRRWLRPNLSLVSNLISLRLWHLKTLFPEGSINLKSFFLKILWVAYILVQLVPFNNYRREKQMLEKIMFYFELRNIISISYVVWSHGSRDNIE